MAAKHKVASTFLKRLANLTDGEFADIRLVCHDYTWYVHRVVLIAHSEKLEQLVARSLQEGEDPEIDMSGDPYHCVEALSKYLYTFNYDTPERGDGVNLHTHICIFADKYRIFDLKRFAIKNFVRALKGDDTTNDVLAEAAELAWGAPDATFVIRNEIVKEALTRDDLLLNDDGETFKFETVMLRHPELAVEMAKAACAKHASGAMG